MTLFAPRPICAATYCGRYGYQKAEIRDFLSVRDMHSNYSDFLSVRDMHSNYSDSLSVRDKNYKNQRDNAPERSDSAARQQLNSKQHSTTHTSYILNSKMLSAASRRTISRVGHSLSQQSRTFGHAKSFVRSSTVHCVVIAVQHFSSK